MSRGAGEGQGWAWEWSPVPIGLHYCHLLCLVTSATHLFIPFYLPLSPSLSLSLTLSLSVSHSLSLSLSLLSLSLSHSLTLSHSLSLSLSHCLSLHPLQPNTDISAYTYERTLIMEQRNDILQMMRMSEKQKRGDVQHLLARSFSTQ